MAKRLTEQDIRRIFREEVKWDREEQARIASFDPEVLKVWWRIKSQPAVFGEEMVQQVIDTYWEVIEEDLNER